MSLVSVHDPMSVRRRGTIRLVVCLVVFALGLAVVLFVLPWADHSPTPVEMIPFALPGAYALVGLIEVVTGVSFSEFARRWDDLKGWQRGIYGTLIVLLAGVTIIAAVGGVLSLIVR